jgi:hypothetical protein
MERFVIPRNQVHFVPHHCEAMTESTGERPVLGFLPVKTVAGKPNISEESFGFVLAAHQPKFVVEYGGSGFEAGSKRRVEGFEPFASHGIGVTAPSQKKEGRESQRDGNAFHKTRILPKKRRRNICIDKRMISVVSNPFSSPHWLYLLN